MPLILHLETSTTICSVCLAENGRIISLQEEISPNSHSASITLLIAQLFQQTNFTLNNLDAVAVNEGPGSYTGLRIGVSVAKGICYALNIPLINLSTTQSLAAGAVNSVRDEDAYYCPVLDSVKNEVYAAMYDASLNVIHPPSPVGTTLDNFHKFFNVRKIYFFGPGASKVLKPENGIFLDIKSSASYMVRLAEERFSAKLFADTAYFEPYYMKSFIPK